MPSIEVGQTVSVRCPLDSSITVTPGAAGTCAVSVQSIESPSFPAQVIGEACTFSVVAGDRVTISARGASATYTDPAFTADDVAATRSIVSLSGIRAALRAAWASRVARRRASFSPVANTATVRYIDTSAANNGDGTAPYPAAGAGLTGAYNTPPALSGANTTYLFAEATTYTGALSVAASGVVLGTYEQTTGLRVFDPVRLATIDGNGAQNVISRSAGAAGWAVSGLRIRNARHATQARGIYLQGDGSIAEFNVIEDILPTGGVSTVSCGIQANAGNGLIVRFNRIACADCDLIQVSENVTSPQNPQVYCNELLLTSVSLDGPDAIQLFAASGFKSFLVADNWIDVSRANVKQGIIVNETVQSTITGAIVGNVVWGADIGVLPKLGTNHQKGIEVGSQNVRVWANFVRNGEYGININNTGCDVRGNVVLSENTPGAASATYSGITAAGTGTKVEHNTVVTTTEQTGSRGIESTVTSGSVQNNVVVGPWARGVKRQTSEVGNVVYGATTPIVNSSNAATAAGSGTTTDVDPAMVMRFDPTSTTLSTSSVLVSFAEDVLGRPWCGRVGAIQ